MGIIFQLNKNHTVLSVESDGASCHCVCVNIYARKHESTVERSVCFICVYVLLYGIVVSK